MTSAGASSDAFSLICRSNGSQCSEERRRRIRIGPIVQYNQEKIKPALDYKFAIIITVFLHSKIIFAISTYHICIVHSSNRQPFALFSV